MSMIKWSESLMIGIDEIDRQHMIFLDIVNELLAAVQEKRSHEIQSQIIDKLMGYAFYHFTKEERYLNQSNYPGTETHKKEHEGFVDKLTKFKKDYDNQNITLTIEMINFMNNWWVNHIKISDKKYQPFLLAKSINN